MLLDISVAIHEARVTLSAAGALDRAACMRLGGELLRYAGNPVVMGDQRAAALKLAQEVAPRDLTTDHGWPSVDSSVYPKQMANAVAEHPWATTFQRGSRAVLKPSAARQSAGSPAGAGTGSGWSRWPR